MPELPEVETIRRHLAPHVDGRRWTSSRSTTRAGRCRWRRRSCRPPSRAGASSGWRRGKYLVWELEDEAYLMLHLR